MPNDTARLIELLQQNVSRVVLGKADAVRLAVVIGIVGSAIGLLGLSWLFPGRPMNPISPLGFLAATIGTFVLLVLYRLGGACFAPHKDADKGQG